MIFSVKLRKEFEKFSLIESELENYRAGNCSWDPPSSDHSLNLSKLLKRACSCHQKGKLFLISHNKKGIYSATALVLEKLLIINHLSRFCVLSETILSLKRMNGEKLVVFALQKAWLWINFSFRNGGDGQVV